MKKKCHFLFHLLQNYLKYGVIVPLINNLFKLGIKSIWQLLRSMVITDHWVNEEWIITLLHAHCFLMFFHTCSIQMGKISVIVDKWRIIHLRIWESLAIWKKKLKFNQQKQQNANLHSFTLYMFFNSNAWANIPLTIENCFCKLQVTKSLCEHIFFLEWLCWVICSYMNMYLLI